MTFQIADMTPLVIVIAVAVALSALALGAVAASFLTSNRRVRLARRERFLPYYGHLVLGH